MHCIIQKNSSKGVSEKLCLMKDFRYSLITGLCYKPMKPANLPMPESWSSECFSEKLLKAIELKNVELPDSAQIGPG